MFTMPLRKSGDEEAGNREPTDKQELDQKTARRREQAQQTYAEQRTYRAAQHGEPLAERQNQDTDDDQKKWKHCVPP